MMLAVHERRLSASQLPVSFPGHACSTASAAASAVRSSVSRDDAERTAACSCECILTTGVSGDGGDGVTCSTLSRLALARVVIHPHASSGLVSPEAAPPAKSLAAEVVKIVPG